MPPACGRRRRLDMGVADGKSRATRGNRLLGTFPSISVIAGTFAGPVSQWFVFFLVARVGGSAEAGRFALLMAIGTPIVTAANWGLRNGYITLKARYKFASFLALRVVGVVIASIALLLFGYFTYVPADLTIAVVLFKAADSLLDIWYGRFQRMQRLLPFGVLMIMNAVLSTLAAAGLAMGTGSAALVVFGSSIGSTVTLVAVIAVEWRCIWTNLHSDRIRLNEVRRQLWPVLRDCWQIGAGQVLAVVIVNIPTGVVGMVGSAHDVGSFAAAAYLITVGSVLGASLNSVSIGKFQHIDATQGHQPVTNLAFRGTVALTSVAAIAVLGIGVIGVDVFQFIYGSEFQFTTIGLLVVSAAAGLQPGTYLMNAALLAVNSYGAQMYILLAGILAAIAAVLLMIPLHISGFAVGAISALVGCIVRFAMSAYALRRV